MLHLKHVLHAPTIFTKFIFTHKLCIDNDVFFEIHSDCFFVIDKHMRSVIIKGLMDKELYKVLGATPKANMQAIPKSNFHY